MTLRYTPTIGRRLIAILFVTQSLASAGLIATFTINPIVGARLSGQDALAGLPGTLLQIGAALAAYPLGRLMQASGRRAGLTLGFLLGTVGMLIGGIAIASGSFVLFLVGLAFIGASRSAIDQGRYAAADAQPIDQRARAISTIVFASTIGSVLGPMLVGPLGSEVGKWGIAPLAGPMFGGSVLLLVGAALLGLGLRPDPRDIARALSAAEAAASGEAPRASRSFAAIIGVPQVQIAVAAMVFGQVVMVLVMTVTSLHMDHHDHGLGDIGAVLSSHTFGMFALSFLTGYLADRFGRNAIIVAGALILLVGALLAPLSLMTPWIAFALFLVGWGWNLCYIGGSSLLADTLVPAERGAYQGLSELAVNISAASAALSSGFIMAAVGYGWLCVLGAILALAPVIVVAWRAAAAAQLARAAGREGSA